MDPKNYLRLIVVLFVIACSVAAATYTTVEEVTNFYLISKNPRQASGILTKIIHGYASEDSTRSYQIAYKAEDSLYSISVHLYWLPEKQKTGEIFEIIYAVDRPSTARIYVFSEYYLPVILSPAILIILVGLFFLVLKKKDWVVTRFSDE